MELKEAIEILKSIDTIDLRENHDVTEETYNVAIDTVLQALEELQKENEELKAKQVMQEFKIDWCEKNTVSKNKIKEMFSKYEAKRENREPVIGYWTLKEFVKKLLEEK